MVESRIFCFNNGTANSVHTAVHMAGIGFEGHMKSLHISKGNKMKVLHSKSYLRKYSIKS